MSEDARLERLLRGVAEVELEEGPTPGPGDRLGAYRIEVLLGAGGMGHVFRARDERLDRTVALKVLRQAHPDALLTEARAAASIRHPNVAALYEVGEADGVGFLAMELIEGRSLTQLRREGPLEAGRLFPLASGLVDAVATLHARGWVHCDIKPDNLVLTGQGLTLLDFGLAASAQAGPRGGTPGYMAPEQLRGELGPAVDVYALGVVLTELATGARFEPGSLARVRPAGLREVLARCLEPMPSRRFADAGALGAALARAQRAAGKRRLGVTALLGVSVLLALGAWGWHVKAAGPPQVRHRRLTARPLEKSVLDAALAADGEHFAFIEGTQLFVQPSSLEVPARAVALGGEPGVVAGLAGTPDFVVTVPGEPLRVLRVDARTLAVTALGEVPGHAVGWSLSGRRAWATAEAITWTEAGVEHRLSIPPGAWVGDLQWSADGRWLAALMMERLEDRSTARLWVFEVEAGTHLEIAEGPTLLQLMGAGVMALAPDGTLFFGRADPAGSSLWRTPLGLRQEPTLVASFPGAYLARISCDGRGSCLTLRQQAQEDAMVAELAPWHERRLSESGFDERPAGWSPDGTKLWLTTRTEGVEAGALLSLEGHTLRTVPRVSWPIELDDGALLAWAGAAEGTEARYQLSLVSSGVAHRVLPLESTEAVSLGRPGPARVRVRCLREPQRCFLARQLGSTLEFSALELPTGRLTPLFSTPTVRWLTQVWDVAPDGRRLVVGDGLHRLAVLDLHGVVEQHLEVQGLERLTSVAWSCQGWPLLVAGLRGERGRLLEVGEAGERELTTSEVDWFGELVTSPDCARVAYVAKAVDADAWLTTFSP